MGAAKWLRRHKTVSAPAAAGVEGRLAQAHRDAAKAATLRKAEENKRDHMQEIARIAERLREENGLSAMVWDILTGEHK